MLEELFSKEVSRKIIENNFSNQTFSLFKEDIKKVFDDNSDYTFNYEIFFKLYKFIQNITKPKKDQEIKSSYRQGAGAMISYLSDSGVSSFDVFAGPLLDQEKTKLRLEGLIQGFKDNQRLPIKGLIRLTFISTKSGYINLSIKSLEKLLDFIISDKEIADYISGFDFSGNESTNNINTICSTVNRLFDFNKECYSRYKRRLKISVHAGENFIDISPEKYLEFFDKLTDLPIDSIGHGVFLWIPSNFLGYPQRVNEHRQRLLKKIIKRNIELEICPTSNVLFSPLGSYKDIPFNFFKEIDLKYSINTDNMAILSTNIKAEYKKSIGS